MPSDLEGLQRSAAIKRCMDIHFCEACSSLLVNRFLFSGPNGAGKRQPWVVVESMDEGASRANLPMEAAFLWCDGRDLEHLRASSWLVIQTNGTPSVPVSPFSRR